MAVTADQLKEQADTLRTPGLVAASTILYANTLVFLNASGYLDDDTGSGANKFAGLAVTRYDNSGGSNGDVSAEVFNEGSFKLTGSGFDQASVGKPVYASDNYTLTLTHTPGTTVLIGVIREYLSSTTVMVELITHSEANDQDISVSTITLVGATGVPEIRLTTNLADALSIEDSAGDLIKFDTTTGTQVITVTPATVITGGLTLNGHLTMGDAKNIALNTTTGTKIGTATGQKLGFWNVTPVVQPTAYTQTYATADKTHSNPTAAALTVADGAGTNDGTIGAITDNASTIAAVQELAAMVNKLVADDADTKQCLNSVIDDLQAVGILS